MSPCFIRSQKCHYCVNRIPAIGPGQGTEGSAVLNAPAHR